MKVKVFRKGGFLKRGYEIVLCDRVRYSVEEKIFIGHIDDKVSAYISDATGYVVIKG
jgi:hypothetical protein